MTRNLVKAILRVWEDQRNSWLQVIWLIKKQIEEIDELQYEGQAFINELADILIITIRYLDQLGLDYEKVMIHRLKTRHRGKVQAIKEKYASLWKKEVEKDLTMKELLILDSLSTSYPWVIRIPINDEEHLEKIKKGLKPLGYRLRFPRR